MQQIFLKFVQNTNKLMTTKILSVHIDLHSRLTVIHKSTRDLLSYEVYLNICSKQCFKCQKIFVLYSSATEIKDTKYDKLNYVHNLIGSYL